MSIFDDHVHLFSSTMHQSSDGSTEYDNTPYHKTQINSD